MYLYFDNTGKLATQIPHGEIPRQGNNLHLVVCFDKNFVDKFVTGVSARVKMQDGNWSSPFIFDNPHVVKFTKTTDSEITYSLVDGEDYLMYETTIDTSYSTAVYGNTEVEVTAYNNVVKVISNDEDLSNYMNDNSIPEGSVIEHHVKSDVEGEDDKITYYIKNKNNQWVESDQLSIIIDKTINQGLAIIYVERTYGKDNPESQITDNEYTQLLSMLSKKVDIQKGIASELESTNGHYYKEHKFNYTGTHIRVNMAVEGNEAVPLEQVKSIATFLYVYATKESFPEIGEENKLYLDLDTGFVYRWDSNQNKYIEFCNFLKLGEEEGTAYEGSKGKALEENKVDKDTTNTGVRRLYGIKADGTQVIFEIASHDRKPSGGTIPMYHGGDKNGRLYTDYGSDPYDAINYRQFVEALEKKLNRKVERAEGDNNIYVYTSEPIGGEEIRSATSKNYPMSVVMRNSDGRAEIATPLNDEDITNKKYVENRLKTKIDKVEKTNKWQLYGIGDKNWDLPNGTTIDVDSRPTPNTVINRNTYGRAQIETPTIDKEIANKKYVDDNLKTKADLVNGKVPTSQLPVYVSDIVNGYFYKNEFYYDAKHEDKITPEVNKIYIDIPNNLQYRWTGLAYMAMGEPIPLGETAGTAYEGNKGKQNADDIKQLKTDLASTILTIPNKVLASDNKIYLYSNESIIEGQDNPIVFPKINGKNIVNNSDNIETINIIDIGSTTSGTITDEQLNDLRAIPDTIIKNGYDYYVLKEETTESIIYKSNQGIVTKIIVIKLSDKTWVASDEPLYTFDETPTENSSNPVTSKGIKKYVDSIVEEAEELERVPIGKYGATIWASDEQIPTAKSVNDRIANFLGYHIASAIPENKILQDSYAYNLEVVATTIEFDLPTDADETYTSELSFTTGDVLISMSYSIDITWTGEDVSNDNIFIPDTNKHYSIIFWKDKGGFQAVVRGY
jgi:hypothetical protein